MNRILSALALVAFALSAAGCDGFSDFVDDPLGDFELQVRVTDAELPFGGDGIAVGVRPGEDTTVEGTVAIENDFGRVDEIESLEIRAEDMAFVADPTPNGRGAAAPSGAIRVEVRLYDAAGTSTLITEIHTIEIVEGRVASSIPISDSDLRLLAIIFNTGYLNYSVTASVVRTEDPAQPLSGTFSIYGYTATVVATPDV